MAIEQQEQSGSKKPSVVVVMPAYNAALTVEKTHSDLPRPCAKCKSLTL